MNMEEYIQALETYVASRKLNLGNGDSVLSLLYEAYGDINQMYDDQIKADFSELYKALNGTPLQVMDWIIKPVGRLKRERGARPDTQRCCKYRDSDRVGGSRSLGKPEKAAAAIV